jgi:hypothetical protein
MRKVMAIGLAVALLCIGLGSVTHIFLKNFHDNRFDGRIWGCDLYQFWYGAQFFWQGDEPYTSIGRSRLPDLKEPRLIGGTGPDGGAPPAKTLKRKWGNISVIPAAAPLFLLLSPLAFLPWVWATLFFAATNLLLGVVFVWTLLRLTEGRLLSLRGAGLLGLLYSLIGTRSVLELGQTSMLVTVCIFGAIVVAERRQVLAGILLGLAFSKYTLGFPLLIYFLCRRQFKAAGSAIVLHGLALLLIALVSGENPLVTVDAYYQMSRQVMLSQQAADYAWHLPALGLGRVAYLLAALLAVLPIAGIVCWARSAPAGARRGPLAAQVTVTIGLLWSLVSLYHGRQDLVAAFPFIVLAGVAVYSPDGVSLSLFRLKTYQRRAVALVAIPVLVTWITPVAVTGIEVYRILYGLSLIAALLTLVGLLFRIVPAGES